MNRMEEYEKLLSQLETVPVSDPVGKAEIRRTRMERIRRSLVSAAAVFLVFVSMINLSPRAIAVCKDIPVLKELVELLTFNPSLRIAVENDYVQFVGQEQEKDGVEARIAYLIVDQKQVNIFFTLTSSRYEALDARPSVLDSNGEHFRVAMTYGGMVEDQDEMRQITIDFVEEDVPDYMQLTLEIRNMGSPYAKSEAPTAQVGEPWPDHDEPENVTELVFDLHFDPKYTAQGRTVTLNRQLNLDGQTVTITDMEIYPTHIRINVKEAEQNTAWLKSLRFYLELENGHQIKTISNGISATGSADTPSMVSYRAESSFFYEADCIRLYITSADFLDKDREDLYINLETLESDPLPQGVKLASAEVRNGGTALKFLVETSELNHVQVLGSTYYDLEGNEYHCGSWSSTVRTLDETTMEEVDGWGDETYYLEGFFESEGLFEVNYTHFWVPEEPLIVELT